MVITITVDDKFQATFNRALVDHGPTVVEELVTNWLNDREIAQFNKDLEDVKADRADVATKARVKARLRI